MTEYRILDVGAGAQSLAQDVEDFKGSEIITLDLPGSGADVELDLLSEAFMDWQPDPFHIIVASHVLEHLPFRSVVPVMRKLMTLLVPPPLGPAEGGGQLHILVPALEWAADRIRRGTFGVEVQMHLYGNQENNGQFHHVGFTMPGLRDAVSLSGLQILRADITEYTLAIGGTNHRPKQHYVVGMRVMDDETIRMIDHE